MIELDEAQTRLYVALIHQLASACGVAGRLILASYGEDPETGIRISPKVQSFAVGEVEAMVATAQEWNGEPHRNVYMPLALMRPDLTSGKKGGIEDVVAVFGLVADFDDDDAAKYRERLPTPPQLVLETSAGRFQAFYFFENAWPADRAQAFARALKDHAACDYGTSDVSHVWRVPGTVNWPNKKKVSGGRNAMPQSVIVRETALDMRLDPISWAELVSSPKKLLGSSPVRHGSVAERFPALPGWLKTKIVGGVPVGKRSEALYNVIAELHRRGWIQPDIVELLQAHPDGLGEKYSNRSDFESEVHRVCIKAEVADTERTSLLEEFNATYAVVNVGSSTKILWERIEEETGHRIFTMLSRMDFKLKVENRQTTGDSGKRMSASDWWLRHPERRQYDNIVLNPDKTPSGCYNLFQGWQIRPAPGRCDLYLTHVKENICSNNLEYYEYLLDLMAHAIQNPSERIGVCIVLRGEEGTGKGVFVKYWAQLFGQHYITVTSVRHLLGNFNAHLQDKLFLFADEAFWAGDKDLVGVLKAIITEDRMMLERKGIDAHQVRNLLRLVIATNNDWAVPAGPTARRFFVLDVSPQRKQDTRFFGMIATEMTSGGLGALMHILLQRDLTGCDLRRVPKTQALLENKLQTLPACERWLHEMLCAGKFFDHQQDWPLEVAPAQLYERFCAALGRHQSRFTPSFADFGRTLHRVLQGAMVKVRPRNAEGRVYHYRISSLDACRQAFSEYIGQPVNWGEREDG